MADDGEHGWIARPSDVLRVGPDFNLREFDTSATPGFDGGKAEGRALRQAQGERLSELQEMLYAEGRSDGDRSVLLVLQGMDTSGKGGISRHVLGMVDPQGVTVRSFGVPTEEERRHHYLWRIRRALPQPGRICVFDRSHYEDVLVVRVHELVDGNPWDKRFDEINRFEQRAKDSGITVVKCAMMISPQEQLSRLAARLERPDKFWKYSPRDLDEREHWDDYMNAYQDALCATSTAANPWHVIPADRKWFARLAVTQLLVDTLEDMNLGWPPAEFDLDVERARMRELIASQGPNTRPGVGTDPDDALVARPDEVATVSDTADEGSSGGRSASGKKGKKGKKRKK